MILVLRGLGVGDLLTAVPALRAIRAGFPVRTLTLAAPGWLTPLVGLIGGVDHVAPLNGLDQKPDLAAPEVAINLHGQGPQSHRMLWALRPAQLWAYASPAAGHRTGPQWRDNEHEVDRWCNLLLAYGLRPDPSDLDLAEPEVAMPRGVTIVHPGAKSRSRRWPHFAEVARTLAAAGHDVVVTGTEAELTTAVARESGTEVVPTGLIELAALVAHARLVISGDTGIAHLATAYRTPSVVLFGPVSPQRWGPPPGRPWHRPIWHSSGIPDRYDACLGVHPSLSQVTASEVIEQAERAMAARPRVPLVG